MHVIRWRFDVAPDQLATFERVYGPAGDWARLFARSADFLGTELVRDPGHDGRYITVDRWATRAGFEAFRAGWKAEYDALDRACAALTVAESPLGAEDT